MRFICSAQRQVELGQLGNQLPVLCKANSLCDVGNDIVTTYKQAHQWFWNCVFRNTRSPLDRVMYIFCKIVRVLPVVLQGVPPDGEKKH